MTAVPKKSIFDTIETKNNRNIFEIIENSNRKTIPLNVNNIIEEDLKNNIKARNVLRKKLAVPLAVVLSSFVLFSYVFGDIELNKEMDAKMEVVQQKPKHAYEREVVDGEVKENKNVKIVKPKPGPKIMGEDTFVRKAQYQVSLSSPNLKVDEYILRYIYHGAYKYNIGPYLLLGIAWKESKFRPNAEGPETRYGTAKGMFQFIDDTAKAIGMQPEDVWNPKIAAFKAAQLISEYSNWFAGVKGQMGMEDEWKNFRANGKYAQFYRNGKWIDVVDHKGNKIPRLLLAVAGYNMGPKKIYWALVKQGYVGMDPRREDRTLPHQTFDYVKDINDRFYNFEYDFTYALSDVDKSKAVKNQ